ncbi:unnamed protein product [Protopolystoma xenopodis]|uniref:Uncharacterized protein n=1 Tax=Protopolystoma xenopodis TaxID=117903 RepID=A0A3S5A4H0_9PLAT|nr:unnamed protein product [Protopolystoma xenopodis]
MPMEVTTCCCCCYCCCYCCCCCRQMHYEVSAFNLLPFLKTDPRRRQPKVETSVRKRSRKNGGQHCNEIPAFQPPQMHMMTLLFFQLVVLSRRPSPTSSSIRFMMIHSPTSQSS